MTQLAHSLAIWLADRKILLHLAFESVNNLFVNCLTGGAQVEDSSNALEERSKC